MRRYLLSQHPEAERRLAQELDAAGLLVTPERPHPRAMEYADLGRLTYLSWVCKVCALHTGKHCSPRALASCPWPTSVL